MRKFFLVALLGASVGATPAFAQVAPTGATVVPTAPGQVSVPTNGADATSATTTDASGTSVLGLGGLLKQTQAQTPAQTDASAEGAGPNGHLLGTTLKTKARTQAHTQGH
jgi:hypothetical protein